MVVALAVLVVVIFIVVRREPENSPATTTPRDPVLQAAIERDVVGSDNVGERILNTVDRGSCVPAGNIDLGPLTGAGPWTRVCVMGTPDGSFQQAGVDGGSDGLHLTYGDEPPAQPHSCSRHIQGRWWEWYVAPGAPRPCEDGFTFQGA